MGVAASRDDAPRPARSRLVEIAWATLWRYLVMGAVAFEVFAGPHVPTAALLALGVGGVLLGLWFRRSGVASVWRAAVLGWATAASAGFLLFPAVLVVAVAVVAVEPWLVARGGRRARHRGRRAEPAASPPSPRGQSANVPVPSWPRAPRR